MFKVSLDTDESYVNIILDLNEFMNIKPIGIQQKPGSL